MNALLPYLKQIADALTGNKGGDKKRDEELTSIAKNIGTAAVTNNNVSMAGNANTKAISDTLAKGLIVTVQDGSSEYEKSIFALMFEMLQNAMFVTVTEDGQQVTKGIAQLLKEQNESISHIKDALYDNTTTPATTVLTKLDEIADAMGSGVDAQTIADGIDQSSALQAIHGVLATDTNNILDKVTEIEDNTSYTQGISVFAESIDNKLGSNNTSGTLLSNTSYIQGISVFVQDIDNKMPNNS